MQIITAERIAHCDVKHAEMQIYSYSHHRNDFYVWLTSKSRKLIASGPNILGDSIQLKC